MRSTRLNMLPTSNSSDHWGARVLPRSGGSSLLPPNFLRRAGFYSAGFALITLCALAVACGDATYSDDTSCQSDTACASDERCVLDDGTQGTCQPVSGANGEEEPAPANNSSGPNNNSVTPVPAELYRFLMLEDQSFEDNHSISPGADIDAIGLDLDGDLYIDVWANSVEDFNITTEHNEYIDTNELLGPPDSNCELKNFTSLGGGAGDSFVIVNFDNGHEPTYFGSGAIVQVWELGPTNCPNQVEWKDEEYAVSISISNDRNIFVGIGVIGLGTNALIIP